MAEDVLLFYCLAALATLGIVLFLLTYLVNTLLDAISWIREDPDHLPLTEDWDPAKSRGRIKDRRNKWT